VLFGASGYTGRLVAKALARDGVRFVLAGRNYQKLASLGVSLGHGLAVAVADARRPESLLELIQPDDVVITTVGPYHRYGLPVAQAAVHRRATYIDACAEPGFIRYVFEELSPAAEAAGVALLPACAYEYVAGNLAAAIAVEWLEELVQAVDVGYFLLGAARGRISAGTRASAAAAAYAPHFAFRDGAVQTVPAGDRVRRFDVDGRSRPGLAIGGEEHLTVPRLARSIRAVGVYAGGPRSSGAARVTARALSAGARLPGFGRAAGWASRFRVGAEGPTAEARARTVAEVVARAYDDGGQELRAVRLRVADPYAFSAEILAWAAQRVSREAPACSGAVGPVEAFGLEPLREACSAFGVTTIAG